METLESDESLPIDGWLIVPAIALVVGPIQFAAITLFELANSDLAPVELFLQAVFRLSYIAFFIFVAVKFFQKKHYAPQFVIALLLVKLGGEFLIAFSDAQVFCL